MTKPTQTASEDIYVLTVYSPHEANTYLLDDYLENPTKAKVLKQLKYDKSPVVKLEYNDATGVGSGTLHGRKTGVKPRATPGEQ